MPAGTDPGSRRRVLFLLPDLAHGGAERVVSVILRQLPRERWEPHLALLERRGELLSAVPDDVPLHDLGARRLRYAIGPIRRTLRELEPAVLFSSMSYVSLGLLALRRRLAPELRIVVREPTLLSSEVARKRLPGLWRAAYRRLYPRADAIVCPARSTLEDLEGSFGIARQKLRLVHNPVEEDRIRAAAEAEPSPYPPGGPNVVGVGRLSPEKGYDRAIDGFAELARLRPEAQLWLVGEGPERPELEARAARLGLAERVHLVGFAANPYPWLRCADAFVQASHYEGMPNALLEALACGTRAVALAAPGGTREVVEASPGAVLVESPDPVALGRALAELVGAPPPPAPTLPPGFSVAEVIASIDRLLCEVVEAGDRGDC
jgi:glycosyltransferase involved in cell wall biosynthesis